MKTIKNDDLKIEVLSFKKIYSKTESLGFGQKKPLISIKDNESTIEKDYYINIVAPIPSKLKKIEIDEIKNYVSLKKKKIYFTYLGIKTVQTELNENSVCRAFQLIYKSKKTKTRKIKYNWYLLNIKYLLQKDEANAVLIESNDIGRFGPETTRGTVTSPRKPPTEKKIIT